MTRARDLADGKHLTNVDSNTLAVDATNNRVFVGASSGDRKFEVHDTGVVVANFKSTGANSLMAFDNSSDTSQNHMIGFSGDDFRVVETTEKIRVLSSGGITFNGDTAATNALDDYEEGTFTPTLNGTSSDPTITYNSGGQQGHYTKVGNLVSFQIRVHTSAYSGGSGNLYISGLPFTASSSLDSYSGAVGLNYQWGSNLNPMAWTIDEGGSVVYLWQNNNNADVVVTGNGAASLRIRLQGFYYT